MHEHFVPDFALACKFTFPDKELFVSLFKIKNLFKYTVSKPQTLILLEIPADKEGIIIRGFCSAARITKRLA